MRYYYIYKITNTINGKYYIGKKTGPTPPEKEKAYLGSGVLIKRAIKKYGKKDFLKEILSTHSSNKELSNAETNAIGNKWKLRECYNLCPGGRGGNISLIKRYHTIETKEKISKGRKQYFSIKENKEKHIESVNSKEFKNTLSSRTKNSKWFTNGTENKRIQIGTVPPSGFIPGRSEGSTKNTVWYNDGQRNLLLKLSQTPPEGFIKGMIKKTTKSF